MKRYWIALGLGLAAMLAGGLLLRADLMAPLPYVLLGLGCGALGHGAGELLAGRAVKNCPEAVRELEIAQKDERNILLAERSKAQAFDLMLYVFGALMLAFALMQVELQAILLLVGAYLVVISGWIVFRVRLEKQM